LNTCQGKHASITQRLLQATSSNKTINATDCMIRATKFVSTIEKFITVNGTNILDIDTAIHGIHNTITSSYEMMHHSCGTESVGSWINSTLPAACITSLRDAAILGHTAAGQMKTNMWGALSAMSSALSSWDKAHLLCPFMANATQTL